jgi:hypothetical protein
MEEIAMEIGGYCVDFVEEIDDLCTNMDSNTQGNGLRSVTTHTLSHSTER